MRRACKPSPRVLPGIRLASAAVLGACLALAAPPVAAGDLAFVTNQNSNDLSVLDLDTRREIRRIPVPGSPAGVAVSPEGFVITVSPSDKTIRKFDAGSGALLGSLQLDGGPIGIALEDRTAYVSDWYNARIWIIGTQDMTLRGTLTTGAAPSGLAVSTDGTWLVSADRDADQLSVFRLPGGALLRQIPVGARPFAVSFGPDGHVYSADVGSNTITISDVTNGSRVAQYRTGERPYGVAFAAGRAFVSDQYADTVSVFDQTSRARIATIDVGEYPEGIAADSQGRHIIVANWFSNTVSVIDADTLTLMYDIETGDGPRAFGTFILAEETLP